MQDYAVKILEAKRTCKQIRKPHETLLDFRHKDAPKQALELRWERKRLEPFLETF